MKVGSIQTTPFGIRQSQITRQVGRDKSICVNGIINNKKISVYSQYTDNKLVSKLYYLQDQFNNLLKFKLVPFKDGIKGKPLIKQTKI